MIRIGIAGLSGRMGALLSEEILAAGAMLTGGTVRPGSDRPTPPGVSVFEDLAALAGISDVVIDFTHAGTVQTHAEVIEATGTKWILGTSGLSSEDEDAVARAARQASVVYAPNFSPGLTLALVMAERMAAALPAADYDAEIVEMHHRQKRDAPSGTAIGLGRAVAAGRGQVLEDVMVSGRHGETGPRTSGEIGFATLRGGQVVGEHSLIFAGASERIILSHAAQDRRVFATGAVRAALWSYDRGTGLFSMRDVLNV